MRSKFGLCASICVYACFQHLLSEPAVAAPVFVAGRMGPPLIYSLTLYACTLPARNAARCPEDEASDGEVLAPEEVMAPEGGGGQMAHEGMNSLVTEDHALLEEREGALKPEQQKIDVLVIADDLGLSLALRGAARELVSKGKSVHWIALSKVVKDIAGCVGRWGFDGCTPLTTYTLHDLLGAAAPTEWDSGKASTELNDVQSVVQQLKPTVVITGTTNPLFLTLASAFRAQYTSKIVAYDDGLRVPGSSVGRGFFDLGTWEAVVTNANELWVVADVFKDTGIIKAVQSKVNVLAVGQPTLQEWAEEKKQMDDEQIAKTWLLITGQADGQVFTITWIGGGQNGGGNAEALAAWGQTVAQLQEEKTDVSIKMVVCPKKQQDNDLAQLKGMEVENLFLQPEGMPTSQAALASDLVVAQGSNAGIQAVFAGKPVLFVDPLSTFGLENLATLLDQLPVAHGDPSQPDQAIDATKTRAKEIVSDLIKNRDRSQYQPDPSKLKKEVPDDPQTMIAQRIDEMLK